MRRFVAFPIRQEHQGLTVEAYMKEVLGYSGRKIQKLTRKRGVLLNGRTVFLQRKIKEGDKLQILRLDDQTYGVLPEPGKIDILYEDHEIIILNKPAGQLVHPTAQTSHGTLANYLANYFEQAGIIHTIRPLHRLDRDTSGCIVFAKNAQVQTMLEHQLREGTLKRHYLALVNGVVEPAEGTIEAPIAVHPKLPNRRVVANDGEVAITHYQRLAQYKEVSLVKLRLETGKTHQIRVHLAHIGYPIIGDRMYGKRSSLIARQALHACSLSLRQPISGQELMLEAPMPLDFQKAIATLCEGD